MDRGAWWAIVHGVSRESDMTEVTQHEHKAHSRYYINFYKYTISYNDNDLFNKHLQSAHVFMYFVTFNTHNNSLRHGLLCRHRTRHKRDHLLCIRCLGK